jgi:hypothetical protein
VLVANPCLAGVVAHAWQYAHADHPPFQWLALDPSANLRHGAAHLVAGACSLLAIWRPEGWRRAAAVVCLLAGLGSAVAQIAAMAHLVDLVGQFGGSAMRLWPWLAGPPLLAYGLPVVVAWSAAAAALRHRVAMMLSPLWLAPASGCALLLVMGLQELVTGRWSLDPTQYAPAAVAGLTPAYGLAWLSLAMTTPRPTDAVG